MGPSQCQITVEHPKPGIAPGTQQAIDKYFAECTDSESGNMSLQLDHWPKFTKASRPA